VNLLDLVPPFQRQINQFVKTSDTESKLAAYLADSVEAMGMYWNRSYAITFTAPQTYVVDPDIVAKDKRPIILMASIIYKLGNTQLASWTDGDFSFQLQRGADNFLTLDIKELEKYVPKALLAKPSTSPLRGFENVYSLESYNWHSLVNALSYYLP
jgi:hypothetical protein